MSKRVTDSQLLGELGEAAVKKIVLEIGFIYEQRGRLEAGVDGLIELRDLRTGSPLGKLLGVQVKATDDSKYVKETGRQFEYLLKPNDLAYWRQSNIPVIIVLWRKSDGSAYWKEVTDAARGNERRLRIDKQTDVFNASCADRLGSLTVDRRTSGVFVPPLNRGESAIINLLRVQLPQEIYIATSPFGSGRDALPELMKQHDIRHDWVIRKKRFVSFFDPRNFGTRAIVDLDQVEAIDTDLFTLNDDLDDHNDTIDLMRRSVERQTTTDLSYLRKERLFYFHAVATNRGRSYRYTASVKVTSAKVVSVYPDKKKRDGRGYVRHHAAFFRFERLADEWFIIVEPTFHFTKNGFLPLRYPGALLAGKKRFEKNAAVRGQVMMWQNLLVQSDSKADDLFDGAIKDEPTLHFERLPVLELDRAVPESSWNRTDPRAKDMEADLFEVGLAGDV